MLNKTRWKEYISDNRWIIIALVFFILWKFFLIHTLWENRLIPPGPDDSYIYILHIDSSLRCDNLISCTERAFSFDTYAGVDHLTYRVFLGSIGKLFHLDALDTYHLGFYVGTILLAFVLVFFLKNLDGNKKPFIAFSIFILALYNGSGSYHGFFWVVPSFFALMLFLFILAILLNDENKHWKFSLAIAVPLIVYTHILGLYLVIILPFFLIFYSYFTKIFHVLIFKKILFTGFIAILAYAPVAIYFSSVSYGNPYGPEIIAKNIVKQKISPEISPKTDPALPSPLPKKEPLSGYFPSFEKIYSDYFRWIFPSLIGYIIFLVCIGVLFYYKHYKLLSIYLAGLVFVFLSSLNLHGERSLIFIWPMTFLLYGQASWLFLCFVSKKISQSPYVALIKGLLIVTLIFFTALTTAYSYLWNVYLNHSRNIEVSEDMTTYLMEHTRHKEVVAYSEDMNFLDAFFLLKYGSQKPEKTIELSQADYYVTLENRKRMIDADFYESIFKKFFIIISRTLLFNKDTDIQRTLPPLQPEDAANFTKEKQFDAIEVYKVNHPPFSR